jgi:hypothetical protein
LPTHYRDLLVTSLFEGEVLNGGVDQFFTNSSGALAPLVVEAFRNMAMPEYAAAFQEGVDLLGTPYPFNRELRFQRMESATGFENFEERFTSLFDRWDEDGSFLAGRLRYAQSQGILPQ